MPADATTVLLQVWDTASGKELFAIRGQCRSGRTVVVFSPDGNRLASFARGAVTIWDAHTGAELSTFTPDWNAAGWRTVLTANGWHVWWESKDCDLGC